MGIDVGGSRKGFHVSWIGEREAVLGLVNLKRVEDVVELVAKVKPLSVAIDAPQGFAVAPDRSRLCEREYAGAGITAIRYTPDEKTVKKGGYYEWIWRGHELYTALAAHRTKASVIEVFPTASWHQWFGAKGSRSRAAWSTAAIDALGYSDSLAAIKPGARLNQDDRDAFGAALTARQHSTNRPSTRSFGTLIVPGTGSRP